MKYKLIIVLYLCLCASLVVRSDEEEEEGEEESGEEDESAEEVTYIVHQLFLPISEHLFSSLFRLLARIHVYSHARTRSRTRTLSGARTRLLALTRARSLSRAKGTPAEARTNVISPRVHLRSCHLLH